MTRRVRTHHLARRLVELRAGNATFARETHPKRMHISGLLFSYASQPAHPVWRHDLDAGEYLEILRL